MTEFDIKYSALRKSILEEEFSGLNAMQREAVFCTEGPLLLLAGAGSGKTTVLINRVINLLKYCALYCILYHVHFIAAYFDTIISIK